MKRALVVGINEFLYHPEAELRGCKNDSLRMRAFLEMELGVGQITHLVNQKAEAERVFDSLQDMVSQTQEGDYLAFTFSSHGTQVTDKDGDEPDGYHEALCCTDIMSDGEDWVRGLIMDKVLRELLRQVPPGARVECWLDTCFAGGVKQLAALGMTYSRARMLRHPNYKGLPKKRLLGLLPPDNVVIWAACKETQTSADTFIDGDWCGAFTYYFLHAFRPDMLRKNLLKLVRDGLVENDYSQVPMVTYGNSELAGTAVGE